MVCVFERVCVLKCVYAFERECEFHKRTAAELIEDDERAGRGVLKDVGRLGQLHEESGLPLQDAVRGTHSVM